MQENELIGEAKTLKEVLLSQELPKKGWVYLPANEPWTLGSICMILEDDDVAQGLEDEDDAGIPKTAIMNGLKTVLHVSVLQQIIKNAKMQKPDASLAQLFDAFSYYIDRDAFIVFN